MQSAITTLIGNEIGKGNEYGALVYKSFILKICLAIYSVYIAILFCIKDQFLQTMTDNPEILQFAMPLMNFFVVNSFLELVRSGMIRGVLKAFNLFIKQVKYTITGQYFLNIFLMWLLAFELNWGMTGIWVSKLITETYMVLGTGYIMESANIKEIIKETQIRMNKDNTRKDK